MSSRILNVVLGLLLVPSVSAQSERAAPVQERHSEVLLVLPTDHVPETPAAHVLAQRLAAEGLVLDHARRVETAEGPALQTVLSASELAAARRAGVGIEVLVEDLAAAVAARAPFSAAERAAAQAQGRITGNVFGSMGGFPTYSETLAILDDMQAQYPDLISVRASLGSSHEGRGVWMVEVGDNPGVDEGEPEALITALHHAREPAGLTTVLYTLWYLLENYGVNRQVTALLDSRRLFVVPILNPDGYVYNETTNPNGGGFWRKNRRNNGGGSRGVDLNRNYGYLWGYDNQGSSGNQSSSTYRGPSAFSEPETSAIRDFLENGRSVRVAFNYHTYGEWLFFPWGYELATTPDHDTFVEYAEGMTAVNDYVYGLGPQLLYPTNGDSDDWMYGEQTTKGKILSYTPEVGPTFWPPSSQIIPLAEENLIANLRLLQYAGNPLPASVGTEDEASATVYSLSATPNPMAHAATVSFSLAAAMDVRLAVYDVLGREAAVLADGPRAAGRHTVRFETDGLANGLYVYRLRAGGTTTARQLVIAR